jgi:exonuclease III
MRIVSWNLRRANELSPAWKILANLNPDIALLQEVSSIPQNIKNIFTDGIKFRKTISKNGKPQQFGTAIFTKGKILDELILSSEYEWVNRELNNFRGNLLSYTVQILKYVKFNIVSVHSPAWRIITSQYKDTEVEKIKLKQNSNLWVTEILWSALKNANLNETNWIVGGDLNCSETFDLTFSSGNREILDRLEELGFIECLKSYNGKLTPTFKNPRDGKVIHQIDHLFVTKSLFSKLINCTVGDESIIFGGSVSDHLPIIADFENH